MCLGPVMNASVRINMVPVTGVFNMIRLIWDSRKAIFFKFDDENLGMTETIEIPKATASNIGKSENAAFGNNENNL